MTQYDNPYASEGGAYEAEYAPQPRMSRLAITSLVCSLIFCCPLTTLLGAIFGVVALVTISGNPEKRGKGVALTGLILGVIFTIAGAVAGYWMISTGIGLERAQREKPGQLMTEAFNQNLAGFRDGFVRSGAQATDAEVQAFVDELTARYGAFQSATFDENAFEQNFSLQDAMKPVQYRPFVFRFENATLDGEVGITQSDASGAVQFGDVGIVEIVIFDPDQGDVVFPPPTN